MSQGGLKHAATESRLETKRERRRGAAGRAAVLRRAPSDSDCSGETASLSADSGDRAVRPPPPPTRTAKSRSRRRGSEWEVLEGLKDGQRFEKRPDVFNGYLHKKRKWPLKGWHKRYFVVDGGILVYARSPTDVARGRLHGSVDVGLSVISAKARRRRIDIDADEFIYHLRAKTPEVFRTWLNVLKAHRLYRQHLLTFGARESVPKIHAPLEDLQPTETSSHSSYMSIISAISTSSEKLIHDSLALTLETPSNYAKSNSSIDDIIKKPEQKIRNSDIDKCESKLDIPSDAKTNHLSGYAKSDVSNSDAKSNDSKSDDKTHDSISDTILNASTSDAKSIRSKSHAKSDDSISDANTNDSNSHTKTVDSYATQNSDDTIKNISEGDSFYPTNEYSEMELLNQIKNNANKTKVCLFRNTKIETTAAYYFFTKKKNHSDHMKRSKKSTNLVKYRNILDEPKLRRPLSKCMLLGRYDIRKVSNHAPKSDLKISEVSRTDELSLEKAMSDDFSLRNDEVTVIMGSKEFKSTSVQDTMEASDYSLITEKVLLNILENYNDNNTASLYNIKSYLNKVVEELYDVKFHQETMNHPVKTVFRCLLEFWLKHNTSTNLLEFDKITKSIGSQSNVNTTVDKNVSCIGVNRVSRGTQYHIRSYVKPAVSKKANDISKLVGKPPKVVKEKVKPPSHSPRRDTESFEKERRVQELERILKNTVYLCDNIQNRTKEKDLRITKTLLDNFGSLSRKSNNNNSDTTKESSSSAEIPKIQETINNLICDTALPPDVAKDFLNAYLSVLDATSKSATENSTSPSVDTVDKPVDIECAVQTDAVIKKISKCIITDKNTNKTNTAKNENKAVDPGQQYLKDLLDKVTAIFPKINIQSDQKAKNATTKVESHIKDELGRSLKEYPAKNLVYEDYDSNSVVINLSKFDLEHISMHNDPNMKGIMAITIKLKEKPQNNGEAQKTHLNLKFSDEIPEAVRVPSKPWPKLTNNNSTSEIFESNRKQKSKVEDYNSNKDDNELKPYSSTCDFGANAYCRIVNESEHSLDLSFKSSKFYQYVSRNDNNEDPQSCYLMSFKKNKLGPAPTAAKKKVRLKECHGLILNSRTNSSVKTKSRYPSEYSVFEKPKPKVIDEKFILLLLENLAFLSKDLPSLYKDINTLFLKLRKKHEKGIKQGLNIHGLSLLGKIYNDEVVPNNIETQACSSKDVKLTRNISTATSYLVSKRVFAETNTNKPMNRHVASTSTYYKITDKSHDKPKDLIKTHNAEIITEAYQLEVAKPKAAVPVKSVVNDDMSDTSALIRNTIYSKYNGDVETTDQAVSRQNWALNTKEDCAVSTIIKCVLNKKNNAQGSLVKLGNFVNNIEISVPKKFMKDKKPKPNNDTNGELINRSTNGKDYQVFQLRANISERELDHTCYTAEMNDYRSEVKLLFKCKSEPSLTSESGAPLENASRELGQAQLSVQQLQRLLDALELQQQVHHDTDVSLEGASPNVKKDRRKFGLRKKKSNSKCASVELTSQHIDPSTSHMALSALTAPPSPGGGASSIPNSAASLPIACAAARPQSLPGAEALATGSAAGPASLTSLTPDHQLREDFTVLAKDLVASLKTIVSTLVCERGRLRAAMEAADSTTAPPGAVVAALRTNLTSALQQNSELRSRLSRIHDASDLAEISTMERNDSVVRQFQQSLSYSSSCVSASEFFDAEEHENDAIKADPIIQADEAGVIELDGDSSSEAGSLSSEEGSASSDNSDGALPSVEQPTLRLNQNGLSDPGPWCRRTRLPCTRPTPGGPSLWNLLYKNIGKDLSQVSMPVTINEPLNMLQRLCEELEYSELLDTAAECPSSVERMSLVAAFAVSAYASSAHRAASKPFNPLLAETYECVRDDKGFRFIAEQVSHHPPISACHAESTRWRFWQEARIKTKFWGKSMEFQPAGRVHVRLATTGDHYSWNKVTTCVHNLFGGQRWVDQYGDMHITCHGTDITCKLNFIKASSWSSTRHEVRGAVSGAGTRVRLQGRWSEALYAGDPPAARVLWRPGAMPPEHELYYGFTRFAMELNEMEPAMRDLLPYTDTRLRPDQRALEEGDVDAAELHKHALEQSQRERRRDAANHQPAWFRKTSEGGEEMWVFTGEYWKAREAGFPTLRAPRIW